MTTLNLYGHHFPAFILVRSKVDHSLNRVLLLKPPRAGSVAAADSVETSRRGANFNAKKSGRQAFFRLIFTFPFTASTRRACNKPRHPWKNNGGSDVTKRERSGEEKEVKLLEELEFGKSGELIGYRCPAVFLLMSENMLSMR